ncbi:MAG: hypothetical protein PHN42_01680 [Bacilli bacterium]|nr:hypothetical protein [Bacilli bacterium]
MSRKLFEWISIISLFIIFLFIPKILIEAVGKNPYQYLFKPLIFFSLAAIAFVFIRKKYEINNPD